MAIRKTTVVLVTLMAVLLSACSFNRTPNRAPVEDRTGSKPRPVVRPSNDTPAMPVDPENAAKPGFYTVKPGDTLNRIGFAVGQQPGDIARWSNLGNPNVLEVGQVLRVAPPAAEAQVAQTKPVTPPGVVGAPVPLPRCPHHCPR